MKTTIKYIMIICLIFCAVSCTKDQDVGAVNKETEQVRIELFTRLNGFNTPVTRSANDDLVNKDPWVIVFSSSDGTLANAKYVEAAQAFVDTNLKSYVQLSPQSNKVWLLILANVQEKFYVSGTPYDFSVDNFDMLLADMTLGASVSLLSAIPLTSGTEVNSPPFNAATLPMSYLLELTGGIDLNTQIGTKTAPLEMVRTVAKITVKNTVPDFSLLGIHSAYNLNNNTVLHNIDGTLPTEVSRVDYIAADPVLSDFVPANDEISEPLYVYEAQSDINEYPYIIIRAIFDKKQYYYKLALVDDDKNRIDFTRNYEYEFTITEANAPGYATYIDADSGNPANLELVYTVKIVDSSAYEIIANSEYFLTVSNRACFIYNTDNDTDEYVVFTLTTNCTRHFSSEDNSITVSNNTVTITSGTSIPIADSPNTIVSMEVKATINGTEPSSHIYLKLGDLEQTVTVFNEDVIPAAGKTLNFYEYDPQGWYRYDYYLLSGELVEDTPWISFSNSFGKTNITNYMQVEDGILDINIAPAASARNAELFLTTIKNPGYPEGDIQSMPRRIKMYIYQSGS